MKSRIRLILLVAGLYGVFLVATFPASQAYALAQNFAGEMPVKVSRLDGSVWSGTAGVTSISGQRISSIKWKLKPLSLLLGKVEAWVDFRDGDNFGRGNVARSLFGDGLGLSDFEASMDIAKLIAISKFPVDIKGNLGMNMQGLKFSNNRLEQADGTLVVQDTKIIFPAKMDLGSLKLTLATDDELVIGTLVDGGGPLQADGILTLGPDDKYKFTGTFATRGNSGTQLERNLKLLGRAGADGKVKVSKSGSITEFIKPLSR